jgi:hypothetical protein
MEDHLSSQSEDLLSGSTHVRYRGIVLEKELTNWDEIIKFLEDHGARRVSFVPPPEESLSLD